MRKVFLLVFLFIVVTILLNIALAQEIPDILTYSQYHDYRELYEPTLTTKEYFGRNIVCIEAVIGPVKLNEFGFQSFIMWIKDDVGYHPVTKGTWDENFPEAPSYGQRIIYSLFPSYYGGIYGDKIQSWEVIEENVDVHAIVDEYAAIKAKPFEKLWTYKVLFGLDIDEDFQDNNQSKIEVIIGKHKYISYDYYEYDLWIKGVNGYYRIKEHSTFDNLPTMGQRMLYDIQEYRYGSFFVSWKELIEENIDVNLLEIEGIETDPILALLKPQFDESIFNIDYSYKKLLRNPDDFVFYPITFEATYFQHINGEDYLVKESDGNMYHLFIKEDTLDFNLLKGDKLLIYGYVNDVYTYSTFSGENIVPTIVVKKAILLEE